MARTLDLNGANLALPDLTVFSTPYLTGSDDVVNNGVAPAALFEGGGSATMAIYSGVMSDGASATALVHTSGITVLTGANTFSGGATVSGGALQIGDGGASGALGTGKVTDNSELDFDRSDAFTFANAIIGVGDVAQEGSGTLTLSGANRYTGGTTISSGVVSLGGAVALGSGVVTFNAGASGSTLESAVTTALANSVMIRANASVTFAATPGTTLTISGVFSNGGDLGVSLHFGSVKDTGTVALAPSAIGPVALLYAVSIDGGTLALGAFGAVLIGQNAGVLTLGTGATPATLDLGGQTLAGAHLTGGVSGRVVDNGAAATLGLIETANATFAGVIADGTGQTSLWLNAAAGVSLTLTGANSYSGVTTIAAGALKIGDGATTGALGGGDIVDKGALVFNRSDAIAFGGAITGAGAVTQSGSGTLTLSGANGFSGGLTVASGVLAVSTAASLGSGAVVLDDGATLEATASLDIANSLQVNGLITLEAAAGQILSAEKIASGSTPGGIALTGGGEFALGISGVGFKGSLTIEDGGVLVLAQSSAAASAILFGAGGGGLGISAGDGVATPIQGFGYGDYIDLAAEPYAASDKIAFVSNGAGQDAVTIVAKDDDVVGSFNFTGSYSASQLALSDENGHLRLGFAPQPTIANVHILAGQTTQTLNGAIDASDAGLEISIYDGATMIATAMANSAGDWTADVTLIGAGPHPLTARATNSFGFTGVSIGLNVAGVSGASDDFLAMQASLAVLSTGQITALAAQGVTELTATDAPIHYTFSQSAAIESASLSVSAPAGDQVREGFSNGSSLQFNFDANDALSKLVTTNVDATFDAHYFTSPGVFNGVSYHDYDFGFSAKGVRQTVAYYGADGSTVASQTFTGDGGWSMYLGGALFKRRRVASDRSFDVHHFIAPGVFSGVAYAAFDAAFTAMGARKAQTYYDARDDVLAYETIASNGGFELYIGGALAEERIVNADGTSEVAFSHVTEEPYVSYQNDFDSAGAQLAHAFDNVDGASGGVNILGSRLEISQASGHLGPSGAAADFTFFAHASETYNFLPNATDDTIAFASGFGAALIKGFTGATAATDVLDLSGLFANVSAAEAAMTAVVGGTLITDSAGDTLMLNGVALGSLTSGRLGFP